MKHTNELAKLAEMLKQKGLHAEAKYVHALTKKASSEAAQLATKVSQHAMTMAEALSAGHSDAAMKHLSQIKQLLGELVTKMPAKEQSKSLSREQKPMLQRTL